MVKTWTFCRTLSLLERTTQLQTAGATYKGRLYQLEKATYLCSMQDIGSSKAWSVASNPVAGAFVGVMPQKHKPTGRQRYYRSSASPSIFVMIDEGRAKDS